MELAPWCRNCVTTTVRVDRTCAGLNSECRTCGGAGGNRTLVRPNFGDAGQPAFDLLIEPFRPARALPRCTAFCSRLVSRCVATVSRARLTTSRVAGDDSARHRRPCQPVDVFGRTPDGKPIPVLHGIVDSEAVGDRAYLNDLAVEWDGSRWVPAPWSDFAVWRRGDAMPQRDERPVSGERT